MEEEEDFNIFIKYFPIFTHKKKAILIFLYHSVIFLSVFSILLYIRFNYCLAAIPAQFLITCGANVPLIYILINFDKLREKYKKKYKEYPWQHLLLHYSYTSPLGCAALYFPLMLTNYSFIPQQYQITSHYLTNSLLPFYISIPIGIFIVIYALLIVKKAGEHDRDMDLYMYVIKPEESRIYKKGIYQYIRHPRILVRFTLSFGFAIIANNFLAILVVFTHYIPYSVYFIISDKELSRRFADEFKTYKKEVPALIPKLKNWGKYLKVVFSKKMI